VTWLSNFRNHSNWSFWLWKRFLCRWPLRMTANPYGTQPTYGVRVRVRVQAPTCTCGSGPAFTCTSGLSIVRSQALVLIRWWPFGLPRGSHFCDARWRGMPRYQHIWYSYHITENSTLSTVRLNHVSVVHVHGNIKHKNISLVCKHELLYTLDESN